MAFRKAFFQVSTLLGCLAFAITLWWALAHNHRDLLSASLHAVGVGSAIIVFALVVFRIVAKYDDPIN
ncbi:MAG TPA: hypothetical protein VHV83_17395 [Armatimonadota bacterium]|nr:hypothetical protein [Armatimonadota bacterium]